MCYNYIKQAVCTAFVLAATAGTASAVLINAGGNVITTSGTTIDEVVGSAPVGGVSDGDFVPQVFTDAPGGFPSDYILEAGAPVFVLDLGSDRMLDAAALWNRAGTGNGNEIRSMQLRLATDAQVASADGAGHNFSTTNIFDSGALVVADLGNVQQDFSFGGTFTGRYLEFTVLDNGFGIDGAIGGDRVGLHEIQFNDIAAFEASMKLTIDRDSGDLILENNTGVTVDIAGLGILSATGALVPGNWNSISNNYDEGGSVSSDEWLHFAESVTELSEGTLGSGSLTHGQTLNLGNGAWLRNLTEDGDITFEYLDAVSRELEAGIVEFIGTTNTDPYEAGDYNFDGSIDVLDWPTQRDNYKADLTGQSIAVSYQSGDLDGDGDNDLSDGLAFKALFEAANGPGSFAAMVRGVPEPSSILLLAMAGLAVCGSRFTRSACKFLPLLALAITVAVGGTAHAQSSISVNYAVLNGGDVGSDVTGAAGLTGSASWNNYGVTGVAGAFTGTGANAIDNTGAATTADITWSSQQTWSNGGNTSENEKMFEGYLDDNGATGVHVEVTDIPYNFYNVHVYFNNDFGTGTVGLFDIDVNGTTHVTTGAFTQPQAGVIDSGNSITIPNLSGGTLNLDGAQRTNPGISNITGFEIVEISSLQLLTLEVNTTTGTMVIKNTLSTALAIDYFEITSAGSSLDEANWTPLGSGGNDGTDWEVYGTPNDSDLSQFYLGDANTNKDASLAPGASLSLGQAFQGAAEDLEFSYHDSSLGTLTGLVTYVTGSSADADGDGDVDGADFLLLQRTNPAGIPAWEAAYPLGASSAVTTAIPEPTSLGLLFLGLAAAGAASRRRS